MQDLLASISTGFSTIKVSDKYKDAALASIKIWLTEDQYQDYVPQIEFLVEEGKWDLLLDCFYQMIPFGTGGRRGMVGIGPNRINPYTIMSSAQGHCAYLLNIFGEEAKTKGVVLSYDVRKFLKEGIYDDTRLNPIKGVSCKDLAIKAAEVYTANGFKVYMFNSYNSTPEMSFMVRHKKAIAGDMISASHNPPEFNGIKVVNESGGQLIPPDDEKLVNIVIAESKNIKSISLEEAQKAGLVEYITEADHELYLKAVTSIDIGDYTGVKVLYSPLHGTGYSSVYPVLKQLGFDVVMDKASSVIDPTFPTLLFNTPNPEVQEAYLNLMPEADKIGADIIIVSDPDADRIGLMSKEASGWKFFNGSEIFALVVVYMLSEMKKQGTLKPSQIVVKTLVTSNFVAELTKKYGVNIEGDLLVGIKYIGDVINKLEAEGRVKDYIIGGEESHGAIIGDYIRDKDTAAMALFVCELASQQKLLGKTLGQFFDELQIELGYFHNYLTEIRLPGAEGMSQIALIQEKLRENLPTQVGKFAVSSVKDYWEGEAFKSESDKVSRNVMVFTVKPESPSVQRMTVALRPSGTEPKSKMYFEIGMKPDQKRDFTEIKQEAAALCLQLEKDFMTYFYKLIGIDFPERGFLIFWQLPALDKMKYFEIEPELEKLVSEKDKTIREQKLFELLKFLGNNPIEKVEKAFIAKNHKTIREFLNLN